MRTIRDCPVAVVGACGFLGSHVTRHLIEDRHCKVLAIDNLVAGRLEFLHPDAYFEHHDVTGSETHLRRLFEKFGVRWVMNYSAYPYVPDSYERPLHVFNVNANGALHVINAAQEAGCEGTLQISSAELYGRSGANIKGGEGYCRAIRETDTVEPHSSYGASKAAIDAMVQVRWRESGTRCIALRQFNCAGRNETHRYVIPEIVSQLSRYITEGRIGGGYDRGETWQHYNPGKSPVVRLGNNSARDFLYAGDQARMATELLEKGQWEEVYNLGSEAAIRIYDLAKKIGRLMGFDEVTVEEDPDRVRPWEIWHLLSSNEKIYRVIESRPEVDLDETLRRTIVYFEENARKWCWEK